MQLQVAGDGFARCSHCGKPAVGPCARCHAPVCGDCCVITEHGVKPYAICLRCDRKGGRSLRSGWLAVLGLFIGPIVLVFLLLLLLQWAFGG
jgi:hypothetical protein